MEPKETLEHCGTCACCPGATVECACVAINALATARREARPICCYDHWWSYKNTVELEPITEAQVTIHTPSNPKPLKPIRRRYGC